MYSLLVVINIDNYSTIINQYSQTINNLDQQSSINNLRRQLIMKSLSFYKPVGILEIL
jgi:hypothetical protein